MAAHTIRSTEVRLRRKGSIGGNAAGSDQSPEIILNLMIKRNRAVGVDGSDAKFGDVSDCIACHEPPLKMSVQSL
jgi:hypothetical protein